MLFLSSFFNLFSFFQIELNVCLNEIRETESFPVIEEVQHCPLVPEEFQIGRARGKKTCPVGRESCARVSRDFIKENCRIVRWIVRSLWNQHDI